MNRGIREVTEEQTAKFFQEVKRQLGLDSTQAVVSFMRRLCTFVPWNYTGIPSGPLVETTSPLFHLLLVNHRKDDTHGIRHLDELADVMFVPDRHQNRRFFRTEMDALSGVIFVLAGIQRLFSGIGLQPFDHTLHRELQQALQKTP